VATRPEPAPGASFLENLGAFFAVGIALLTPFLRSRRRRWGARDEEINGSHPGDALVPEPRWTANHAISIEAPADRVWPWIAQLGQGRGGFYSYQGLENLAGCKIVNTARILEEHQQLREGDPIRLHVAVPPMSAAIVREPTALVLLGNPGGDDDAIGLTTSWALIVLEQPDGTTRLLSRTRYDHGDGFLAGLAGGPTLIEPISFVMERKMLRVIKGLAEREARPAPGSAEFAAP
jgi:hypothetical protein